MLKKVEAAGFYEVILYFNVGMKPHAQVKEEMDRFMREVAPNFQGKHRSAAPPDPPQFRFRIPGTRDTLACPMRGRRRPWNSATSR